MFKVGNVTLGKYELAFLDRLRYFDAHDPDIFDVNVYPSEHEDVIFKVTFKKRRRDD